MKELLNCALRLAIADTLSNCHNGCLPLVFDDAFTNSDSERVPLIKKMLRKATDQGLQIILLTCAPKAYQAFADKSIMLSRN